MNRFRVGLTSQFGKERIVAVLDTLGEARMMVEALADYSPWIEWGQIPDKKLAASEGEIRWRRTSFTADERAKLEAIYLTARNDLQQAGMAPNKVDRLLPLGPDGGVPWD
jgi:hypothetical protein